MTCRWCDVGSKLRMSASGGAIRPSNSRWSAATSIIPQWSNTSWWRTSARSPICNAMTRRLGRRTGSGCIQQFIGEAGMVGCGHGSAFIRAFTDELLAAGTPRIITDPDPANARAVRAYEKAGFLRQREVDTPDGRALLMVRNA